MLETAAINIFRQAGGTNAAVAPEEYDSEPGDVWKDLLGFRLNRPANRTIWLLADGILRQAEVGSAQRGSAGQGSLLWHDGDDIIIVDKGWPHIFKPVRTDGTQAGTASDGALLSPMPGRVIAVLVAKGDSVTKGQTLLTLEAMKMEHTLTAPFDGTVADLTAREGDQVQVDALLVRIVEQGPP